MQKPCVFSSWSEKYLSVSMLLPRSPESGLWGQRADQACPSFSPAVRWESETGHAHAALSYGIWNSLCLSLKVPEFRKCEG